LFSRFVPDMFRPVKRLLHPLQVDFMPEREFGLDLGTPQG